MNQINSLREEIHHLKVEKNSLVQKLEQKNAKAIHSKKNS
jgi:hypothetical protein